MTPYQALYIEYYSEALKKQVTIKEYFKTLLEQLWREEESFSGKRPFGDSGWQREIYEVLIDNEILDNHKEFVIEMIRMM